MSIHRIKTVQGHPIPSVVSSGDTPWDPALFRRMEKAPPLPPAVPEFPPGATVLNGMQGVPLFSCDACGGVVAESEIPYHVCQERMGGYEDYDDEE